MKKITVLFFLQLLCASIFGQFGAAPVNTVSVTGHSTIQLSPDHILLQVTLSDEYCAGPKENIDALTALYNEALIKAGVEKSKSKLTKELRTDLGYTNSRKTTEMISRIYQLELISTNQYEVFKTVMISKGVQIEVLELTNSAIESMKQNAQRNAIIAAKDKANNYVAVAGGKLGKVLRIDEDVETFTPSEALGGSELAEGVTFPIISNDIVSYEVSVIFELQ